MMHRAIIHVDGPQLGGKTTFIEAVLGMELALVNCLRATHDARSKRYRESRPARDDELRRYRDAGAGNIARLRFGEVNGDEFYATDFMCDYSEAVIIEGAMPAEFADLEVFVGPAPPDGKGLVRSGRAAAQKDSVALDRLYASRSPVGFARLLREEFGDGLVAALFSDPKLVKISFRENSAALRSLAQARNPESPGTKRVAPGYEGLESAGLCIITCRDEVARIAADRFADEVRAMRADSDLRRALFGPVSRYAPSTIVTADLGDPRDPGMKKALACVRRALRKAK